MYITLLTSILLGTTFAQKDSAFPKRGIAYHGTPHDSDYDLFTSSKSPMTWYYNWSPYPVGGNGFGNLAFAPLIHGISDIGSNVGALRSLPDSSTHLLTFNEPDGSTESGGSAISPQNAAAAYLDYLAPLSVQNGGRWKISWPSTTGTYDSGLPWLRLFNYTCWALNDTHGCVQDFVAAHWYGGFEGMASWLGALNEYYNTNTTFAEPLPIWVTELGLPQASAEVTEQFMNQTLPYLDGLDYVEKYSWFGVFRKDDANGWTGDGVALLDNDGDLTELGSQYLGGNATGFSEGMGPNESAAPAASTGNLNFKVALAVMSSACLFALGLL